MASFERMDLCFERTSTVGSVLMNIITCFREIIQEGKSQLLWHTSWLSHLKKLLQPPQRWAPTTQTGSSHQHEGQIPPPPEITAHCRLRWWLAIFSHKVFFNWGTLKCPSSNNEAGKAKGQINVPSSAFCSVSSLKGLDCAHTRQSTGPLI